MQGRGLWAAPVHRVYQRNAGFRRSGPWPGCPTGYCVKYPETWRGASMGRTDWDAEEARWSEQIAAVVGKVRAWRAAHPRATFREITEAIDAELNRVRAQLVAEAAAGSPVARFTEQPAEERPRCGQCGGKLVGRGRHR